MLKSASSYGFTAFESSKLQAVRGLSAHAGFDGGGSQQASAQMFAVICMRVMLKIWDPTQNLPPCKKRNGLKQIFSINLVAMINNYFNFIIKYQLNGNHDR